MLIGAPPSFDKSQTNARLEAFRMQARREGRGAAAIRPSTAGQTRLRNRVSRPGSPGMNWRERLKAMPIVGRIADWAWALLSAARFKAHVLAELDRNRSEVSLLTEKLAETNQFLRETGARLQRIAERSVESAPAQAVREEALPAEFYLALENAFRGSAEAIRERASAYLPRLEESPAAHGNAVLDIGCGRGEWLALLEESGYRARGIDADASMVEACRQKNLSASQGQAVEALLTTPDQSLGALTCFHVVEHLPPAQVVALLSEAHRALVTGGLVIVETPNPENLQVSGYSFYTDPTHRHPMPPPLLEFIARYAGFDGIEIVRLNPYPEFAQDDQQYPPLLRKLLFCGQDYALIARK